MNSPTGLDGCSGPLANGPGTWAGFVPPGLARRSCHPLCALNQFPASLSGHGARLCLLIQRGLLFLRRQAWPSSVSLLQTGTHVCGCERGRGRGSSFKTSLPRQPLPPTPFSFPLPSPSPSYPQSLLSFFASHGKEVEEEQDVGPDLGQVGVKVRQLARGRRKGQNTWIKSLGHRRTNTSVQMAGKEECFFGRTQSTSRTAANK